MKLILFAQTSEAEATIEQLGATPIPGHKAEIWSEGVVPTLYRYEDGVIAITNIGLHSAAAAVAKYSAACSEIWNIGFAGALKGGLDIACIVPIRHVGKYVPLDDHELDLQSHDCLKQILPDISLQDATHSLISSDFPIHNKLHRDRLAPNYDLVDMEGYAIAHLAKELGKKCYMWKIVSDFATPGGRELIRKNKRKLSEEIARHIINESSRTT